MTVKGVNMAKSPGNELKAELQRAAYMHALAVAAVHRAALEQRAAADAQADAEKRLAAADSYCFEALRAVNEARAALVAHINQVKA